MSLIKEQKRFGLANALSLLLLAPALALCQKNCSPSRRRRLKRQQDGPLQQAPVTEVRPPWATPGRGLEFDR